MKTGTNIDSDKLRIFCDSHGGIAHVAKTIGRTSTGVRHAIKVGRASEELLKLLRLTYGFTDVFPDSPTRRAAPEPEPVSNETPKTSVVDELIDAMRGTASGSDSTSAHKPVISTGQKIPSSYTWRDKTLAEMTGDDIDHLVNHVVSGVLGNVLKELLTMNVQVSLKKEGGRYGW